MGRPSGKGAAAAKRPSTELSRQASASAFHALEAPSPWDTAGPLSRLSFAFVRPLLRRRGEDLAAARLLAIARRDRVARVAARLDGAWAREVARAKARRRPPRLGRAILACFADEIAALGAWMGVEYAAIIAQAALIGPLIDWIASDRPLAEGAAVGAALVACSLGQALAHHAAFYVGMRLGWNARLGMTKVLHAKLLATATAEVRRLGSGFVFNLVATDVQRFDAVSTFLWAPPLCALALPAPFFFSSKWVGENSGKSRWRRRSTRSRTR